MKTLKAIISILAVCITVILVQSLFPANAALVYGVLIFTAPGGAATPFNWNMTYLPQWITFTNAVALTSLRVETQQDGVLHDWTAAGLVAMSAFMFNGTITANMIALRIANGEVKPKNVLISGVTSGAGVVPFFVSSDQPGTKIFKSTNANILALNPTTFTDFTAIWTPTMATATDYVQVFYKSGHTQTFAMEDLRNLSAAYQQVPGIILNNVNGYIQKAVYQCAAATPAYILSVKI